jgi:hypothetical protein
MSYVKWRAWVGAPFTRPSSAVHWDWSTLAIDAVYNPGVVVTTLTAQAVPGASTINVSSAGSFPSTGGIWLGDTRQSYVRYSGKTSTAFTGCVWTGDAEEQITHANGSTVRLWREIYENNGNLSMQWSMDSNLATMQWAADIGGGAKIPQAALRNNHLILVQRATSPGGSFTNWLIGWLLSPDLSEAKRKGWSAKIISSAQKTAEIEVDGIRSGDLNIARDGSASAISTLAGPYKERYSGDYTAAEPDLSPSAAIDGSETTLWISEDVIGTPLPMTTANDPTVELDMAITQVHIYPNVGEPSGYQWIEITVLVDGTQPDVALWTSTSGYAVAEIAGDYTAGDKIIICADDVLFQQQNPRCSAALIFSLEDSAPGFFSGLNLAGDSIGMYYTSLGGGSGWVHDVVWGTGTVPDRGASNPTDRYGHTYTGGNVPAPGAGQTLRYTFANSSTPKNNWVVDYNDHAGYRYSYGNAFDEPWLLLDLPPMGLMLAEDLDSGFTGTITIKDDSGDTTGGLPIAGTIQIGSNLITFNNKTNTTIDVTGGVTSDHVAGDPIYVYYSGIASDGVVINEIRWSSGDIYFKNFDVYYSRLPNARTPGTSGYLDDYVQLASVTNHASSAYSLTMAATRARKVLILPTKMNVDPARMRVREVEVLLDRTFYNTDLWLPADSPVVDIFEALLTNAYIPSGAISATDDGYHDLSELNTEKQKAWPVIADLADFSGYRVKVGRDSKFTIAPDTFWTSNLVYSPTVTWTRANAAEVKELQDGSGVGAIKQVRLTWKSADGESEGVSVYPPSGSEDWRGSVSEIGPYIFANSTAADAAARKHYFTSKYPYTFYVRPMVPGNYEPGQIHRLQWQFSNSWGVTDRYCMVTNVANDFSGMRHSQSLNMIQVSREVPN